MHSTGWFRPLLSRPKLGLLSAIIDSIHEEALFPHSDPLLTKQSSPSNSLLTKHSWQSTGPLPSNERVEWANWPDELEEKEGPGILYYHLQKLSKAAHQYHTQNQGETHLIYNSESGCWRDPLFPEVAAGVRSQVTKEYFLSLDGCYQSSEGFVRCIIS